MVDRLRLFYQCLDHAEAFNSGEPVIDSWGEVGMTAEQVDADIAAILEHFPYAGYWVFEDESDDLIKFRNFDYEAFNKDYYGG